MDQVFLHRKLSGKLSIKLRLKLLKLITSEACPLASNYELKRYSCSVLLNTHTKKEELMFVCRYSVSDIRKMERYFFVSNVTR